MSESDGELDPEPCHFCDRDSIGIARFEDGYWAPSCAECIEEDPRCRFVSPSPWGPAQCVLPDGHAERHAFSPSEASDD